MNALSEDFSVKDWQAAGFDMAGICHGLAIVADALAGLDTLAALIACDVEEAAGDDTGGNALSPFNRDGLHKASKALASLASQRMGELLDLSHMLRRQAEQEAGKPVGWRIVPIPAKTA